MEINNSTFEEDSILGNGDILNELYEEITSQEVEELGIDVENERFQITTEEQANFFMRQLEEIRRQISKVETTCDTEIERYTKRVNEFKEKKTGTLKNTENYFLTLLENYARVELSQSKKKTIKTPFGTLSFKNSPSKFNYDEEVLMNFIKKHNLEAFVKVKEEINKKDLRAAVEVQEDGSVKIVLEAMDGVRENSISEVVEGILVTPGEEKFTVK